MHAKNKILAMALVNRLIEAGSPFSAVGDRDFTVVAHGKSEGFNARIAAIMHHFEPIEPLRASIVDYLREFGPRRHVGKSQRSASIVALTAAACHMSPAACPLSPRHWQTYDGLCRIKQSRQGI